MKKRDPRAKRLSPSRLRPRPRALGVYIFAGGFTVGVLESGFDVIAHLEGNKYGVESARLNFPNLPIYVGTENWPLAELAAGPPIDFIFANPPCAVFSPIGIRMTRGAGAWRSDPRTSCWFETFELLERLKPRVWACESVPQAYTTGREMIDDMTRRALLLGYSVTHLHVDAKWTGIPQSRRRFFLVCHRPPTLAPFRSNWSPPPTVGEVLAEVKNHEAILPSLERELKILSQTQPGEKLSAAFNRIVPAKKRKIANGKVKGRLGFLHYRLHPDKLAAAWTSDMCYHPTENRRVSFGEAKVLCGYPPLFKCEGSPRGWGSLLARAVLPPVGAWLARAVAETLAYPDVINPLGRRVTLADYREPDRVPIDLTEQYLTSSGKVRLPAVRATTASEAPEPEAAPEPELPSASKPKHPAAPVRGPVRAAVPGEASDEPPRQGEGSGKFIQRVWLMGKYHPDEIVALVHRYYEGRKTTRADVSWNYHHLIKSGVPNVPPWPTLKRARQGVKTASKAPTPLQTTTKVTSVAPAQPAPPSKCPSRGVPAIAVKTNAVLVTGMTPTQCGSDRTQLKIATATRAWVNALTALGYVVDFRGVTVGENLTGYKKVLIGLTKPNAIAAGRVFSGLEALRQRPDAIAFVDDWQTHEFHSGFKVYAAKPERIWRLDRAGRDAARDRFEAEYVALYARLAAPEWDFPVIAPIQGRKQNLELLRLPAPQLIGFDPTPFVTRYPVPAGVEKTRRWLWASLVAKDSLLNELTRAAKWPILAFGSLDRGEGGIGKRGAKAQPRKPEPELIADYAAAWGVVMPRHAVSGSGWWRNRYTIARDVGSIIYAPIEEARLFGPAYEAATDPRAVEKLDDVALTDLAIAQQETFDTVAWSRERLLTELAQLLDERRG